MSRTVVTNVESAILAETHHRQWVRCDIDPSRTFFSALAYDNPYEAGNFAAIDDTPRGQCAVFSATDNVMYSFMVKDSTGEIELMEMGSGSKYGLGVYLDVDTKPGIWDLGNGTGYLWGYTTGNVFTRWTVDYSTRSITATDTVLIAGLNWTIDKCSCTPISSTEVVIVFRTSIGGVALCYYDGSSFHEWNSRFFSPAIVTSNGYSTIYSTACKLNGNVYVYMTDLNRGCVLGACYNPTRNTWEDSFIALPADLTRFCITNAVVANGFVHLAGQFHRTGDLAAAQVYSLVLRSPDGKNFSWDRFSLLSSLGYQFNISLDTAGDRLWASDRNCVGWSTLSYFFVSSPATRVSLEPPSSVIKFNTNGEQGQLRLAAADETLIHNPILARGNRVSIEVGYSTASGGTGIDYTLYQRYIIDGREVIFKDGMRSLVFNLVAEGAWKTNQIAFPFYAEIISKSCLFDDCDERDHAYPAAGGSLGATALVVDFWNNEGWTGQGCTAQKFRTDTGPGCERKELTGAYTYGFTTQELMDLGELTDNPEITTGTVDVKFYGWARTDNAARDNDVVTLYLVTIDANDTETTRTGNLTSTYSRFAREYPTHVDGSYPIIYQFTSLPVGDRIKFVCVKIVNAEGTNKTTFCPERLEINGVRFSYSTLNPSLPWSQTRPSTYQATDPTILEVPETGLPFVLFASKPYTAFNFSIHAQFIYEAGAEPISAGMTAWGLVGVAKDASNYIVARVHKQSSEIQLVKVRDGDETELATWDASGLSPLPTGLMLDHRDGYFLVSYYDDANDLWENPVISYHWNEVTQGAISTSTTDIMHVGLYGAKMPPGFRIPGFNVADSEAIPMISGEDITTITNFPASGKVIIDDIIYSYDQKTPLALWYGPHGGRNTNDYGSYSEGGVSYSGMAAEIGDYQPQRAWDYLKDYVLALDNGHCWLLSKSDWTVEHHTAGQPVPLRNRVRHYGGKINGNYVGTNGRCYETVGLLAPQQVEQGFTMFHGWGSWCFLYGTDRIWLQSFTASSVDHDATVRDMVAMLCRSASVEPEFPGDWTQASLALTSGVPAQIAASTELFPGGADVEFTIPALSANQYIQLNSNNFTIGVDTLYVRFANIGGYIRVGYVCGANQTQYFETTYLANTSHNVRVLIHAGFVSTYIDGYWIATRGWNEDDFTWPQTGLTLYLASLGSYTVSNLRVVELFDWREAVYIESEMNAASAIGSVLQERPVEIYPTPVGGLSFSYRTRRDTIVYDNTTSKRLIRKHTDVQHTGKDAGSDAVIYYMDVAFTSDLDFAVREGFLTRVLKLSSLETGAKVAGQMVLERANSQQYQHTLDIRPDIRIEPGDILDFHYRISGTESQIDEQMIVTQVSLALSEMERVMSVTGRRSQETLTRQDAKHGYMSGV